MMRITGKISVGVWSAGAEGTLSFARDPLAIRCAIALQSSSLMPFPPHLSIVAARTASAVVPTFEKNALISASVAAGFGGWADGFSGGAWL